MSDERLDEVFETVEDSHEADADAQDQEQQQEAAETELDAEAESEGEADAKGETDAETPSAEKDDAAKREVPDGHIPIAAYQDEKRKRQEAEKRAQQLEEKLKPIEEVSQKEEIDIFSDPDGFIKSIDAKIEDRSFKDRANISRYFLEQSKPDYSEKEQRFIQMAKEDPALASKLRAHPYPAVFAYETASRQMVLDKLGGDPAAYEKQLEERLRAKILAELKGVSPEEQPGKAQAAEVERVPSLATASGASKADTPTLSEMDEVFAD